MIYVLAGVNGAGKSSLGGEMIRDEGIAFFNPDKVAQRFQESDGRSLTDANAAAWTLGKDLLERAIVERSSFAFETTLGGATIPRLLRKAAETGIPVDIWYVGLASVELHLQRVQTRVAEGGHDIPEWKIRERWERSPRNLIELMPVLSNLRVFDNSAECDSSTDAIPDPRLLLRLASGSVLDSPSLEATPMWARSIVERALELHRRIEN